ncbi:predicted protein [Postia placenta Mad-698-R]|nr:predicted protein [Postia placenta Mad-698-R]
MSDGIVLQPALNEALGPALIGTIAALALVMSIIDAALYGLSCAQVIYYAAAYPKDKLLLKGLVAILWLLDTAAAVVDAMIVWHYTIKTKTDIITFIDVFRGMLRQSEYALAVGDFKLYGHTNLTAERFGQAPTIFIVQCANQVLAHRTYKWPLTIIMVTGLLQTSTATLVDICATVTLLFVLRGQKTGFKAIVQIAHIITYVATTKSALYWTIFHLPASKIHFNSFLAVLNARQYLNRSGQKYLSNGFSIMDLPGDPTSPDDIPLGDRQMGNIDHASRYIGYESFQAHTIHE